MAAQSFTVTNETDAPMAIGAFRAIKEAALGKRYQLSLVIAAPARMKELNSTYRGLKGATDILSFPIAGDQGEIYLCPAEAEKEAPKFGRDPENFLSFLFIHGCVHLKGYDHGATMERIEAGIRNKFGI